MQHLFSAYAQKSNSNQVWFMPLHTKRFGHLCSRETEMTHFTLKQTASTSEQYQ